VCAIAMFRLGRASRSGDDVRGHTVAPVMRPLMKTPTRGAATSIHLASAAEVERVSGHYFVNSKPTKSSERSYDQVAAARLRQVSADLVDMTAADSTTAGRPSLGERHRAHPGAR
jgi:hypothetical protein